MHRAVCMNMYFICMRRLINSYVFKYHVYIWIFLVCPIPTNQSINQPDKICVVHYILNITARGKRGRERGVTKTNQPLLHLIWVESAKASK